MQEVYPGIFIEPIPLPKNPLKAINNYIIQSEGETMMVDTAFDVPESLAALQHVIEEHHLDLEHLTLFLTHLHSDHTGLAHWFQDRGAKILMGDMDGTYVRNMTDPDSPHWHNIQKFAKWQGLDCEQLRIEDHPGFRYRPKRAIQYTAVAPGDTVDVGAYHFTVIDLKGHTPGMLGLYEPTHKLFFCGDHILGKITPNIAFWGYEYGDILGTYFENLNKVRDMEIDHLFSSHRELIPDHRARIDALFAHHQKRLDETLMILHRYGKQTVREVTKRLSWDISAKNWDDFPKSQKWFAAGEAHTHLEHLFHTGQIERIQEGEVYYYAPKQDKSPE